MMCYSCSLSCLHFPMAASTRGCVPWCVVVWWHFHVAGWLQHLKKKKNSLIVMVGYCLLEWAWILVSSLYSYFFSRLSLLSILVLHVTQLNEASEFVLWQFVLLCSKSYITMSQSKLTGCCMTGCCSIWITLQLAVQSIECLNGTVHIALIYLYCISTFAHII